MRFKLVRLRSELHFFLWSSHHLLLDRWCLSTLYRDFSSAYASACNSEATALPKGRPFRNYISWIQQQSRGDAERFWRSRFSGFAAPTFVTRRLDEDLSAEDDSTPVSETRTLTSGLSDALREFARVNGITLSILAQGALALSISRATRRPDVMFGTVVSGRPSDLADVESIVGSFINNVPVPVHAPLQGALLDWLKALQAQQVGRSRYEYVSLADMQDWSDLPVGVPLFDTLLVWLSRSEPEASGGLTFEGLPGPTASAFPLTLSVSEEVEGLTLRMDLKPDHAMVEPDFDLLDTLQSILQSLIKAKPESTAVELGIQLPDMPVPAIDAEIGRTYRYRSDSEHATADTADIAGGRESLSADALIDMLRAEWQVLLNRDAIGLDEDFFTIGGTSLLAARLHASVEINTRQSVPLMTFFQEPTIKQMAATLLARDWPLKANTVIPVKPRGVLPPLFCVASPDVNTLGYTQLARHLSDEQPVFVLQSPPDSDRVRRLDPDELPALATAYVKAMREVQPEGPYYLLGMCTGAHVSFEMANQLGSRGNQVAFLGIVNTWAFYTVSKLYYLAKVINRFKYYRARFADLAQQPAREQLATVKAVAQRRLKAFRLGRAPASLGATGVTGGSTPVASGGAADRGEETPSGDPWIDGVGWVGSPGDIDKFSGSLIVYRIRKQQFWRIRDAGLGWGRFADQIRVESLPGKVHDHILREPGVRLVAERLGAHLREAQKSSGIDNNCL
jgi:hypothetical protein